MEEDEEDDESKRIAPSQDASFLRRFAGSSNAVQKAGLAQDQTEINRKIAEASKGSKFYENEKRRDADWAERINNILNRRDELLREADIAGVEARVDREFAQMEAKRDLSQTIIHIDMDAFYANVELQHNPELKGKPFAVCGLGIVTTASYDARKFGVRSAMPEFVAKKLCPEITIVPVDYKRVSAVSSKVIAVCKNYDPNMYVAGCDEGYLNITKYLKEHELGAAECTEQIRAEIFAATNMTASAGIASNMLLAKICSDKNKPNGQYQIPPERDAILKFMHDLPVRKVPGIGRVGERVLEAMGVKTCGDIRHIRAILWLMPRKFAVTFLFEAHLGISSNEVGPPRREERKSVGASRTFRPVSTKEAIFEKIEYIASLLERDLELSGWAGKVVILTYKLDSFRVFTRQATFGRWISKKEDLVNIGKELIRPYLPLRIRLLGLRVTAMKDLRAPDDQGIKRYFGQDGTGSPSKKNRARSSEESSHLSSPSKDKGKATDNNEEGGTPLTPITVEGGEVEGEDEVIGQHEDECEDEFENEINDHKHEYPAPNYQAPIASEESEVPLFRYGRPVASASYVVKVGNERRRGASSTRFKPKSTVSRTRLDFFPPAPKRSKSEQPIAKLVRPKSMTPELHISSRAASPAGSSSIVPRFKTPTSVSREATPATPREFSTCPICSRKIEGDNSALNAHVDYCLSKGAIMEATAASSPKNVSSSSSKRKRKD